MRNHAGESSVTRSKFAKFTLPMGLVVGLFPWFHYSTAQEGQVPKEGSTSAVITGTVMDYVGAPLSGASVKVAVRGPTDGDCKATSDKDGAFTLSCLPPTGDLTMKVEMPGCSTVVRQIPSSMRVNEIKPLKFILQCGDPPVPIRPHAKAPGVSFTAYVGHYKMTSVFRDAQKREEPVTLYEGSSTDEHKCLCRKEWKLASVTAENGCKGYGCWRVREDGDIEVYFPCEGLAFAGSNWTLWREGKDLVGQGSSWSDVGGGRSWQITLTNKNKK